MEKQKLELPPLKQSYELNDSQQRIVDRFLEEIRHRVQSQVTVEFYRENFLAYPSKHSDTIMVDLTIGNWHRVASIIESELAYGYGEPFYYFFRKLTDDVMADLLRRGANFI